MKIKAETELISTIHRIDTTVVRMDQKLTDHISSSEKKDKGIDNIIFDLNDRVLENTKFRNRLLGMGKVGTVLIAIGTVFVLVFQTFNGKK